MQATKLDLNDSRKVQPRRAGLTRDYHHNLLQSINRSPKKEEQPEMPVKAGTKSHPSNAKNTGAASDVKPTKSRKRGDKGSDKENGPGLSTSSSSAMKNTITIEDEDVLGLPEDSDDGLKYISDSSDDESPAKVSADMTKTSFRSKNNKSSQTSTASPVPSRKSTKTKLSDSNPNTSLKRKKESESKNDPELDMFGRMQSSDKKPSYIQAHKEHKRLKPGANKALKKSYGKKKTTTYGKKSSPATVFKHYGSSSPSLMSDDGKEKFKDYSTETPTKMKSPVKSGFIPPPDFSDDDFSDLGLPSKNQQSDYALPSTQFKQLQRYDGDDIMDGAEELAKKLNSEAIAGLKDFEEDDNSDLDDYTGSRCPMCNEPVAAEDLEAFGEMNTRKQEKFCISHQRKSARSDWKSKGYPDIDWTALDSRIASHYEFIRKIIGGAPCPSRDVLDEMVRAGKDRNLMKSTTNLIPGYYGSRGLRLMSENIMKKFTPMIKARAPIDRLLSARTVAGFVEMVVIPEVTVLLIKEDMNVEDEYAREILKESCDMGDLVNEEIKDVVKLKPKKKLVNDSEDDENDFDF